VQIPFVAGKQGSYSPCLACKFGCRWRCGTNIDQGWRKGGPGRRGVGAFRKQGVGSVWLPAACYLLAHAKISLIRMAEPGGTKPA